MSARCPVCLSDEVYRSRSGNPKSLAPLRMFTVKVRCANCMALFRVRGRLLGGPRVDLPHETGVPGSSQTLVNTVPDELSLDL